MRMQSFRIWFEFLIRWYIFLQLNRIWPPDWIWCIQNCEITEEQSENFLYFSIQILFFKHFFCKRVVMNNYIWNNYFITGNYLHWLALENQNFSFSFIGSHLFWMDTLTHSLFIHFIMVNNWESWGASRPVWKFSATATRKVKCDNRMQM